MTDDNGEEGKRRKRKGMARAVQHANPEWLAKILECGLIIAKRQEFFTFEQVEALRREMYPFITTQNPNASGGAMKSLVVAGYCEDNEDYWNAREAIKHSRKLKAWRSLLYIGPKTKKPIRARRVRKAADPYQQPDLFE